MGARGAGLFAIMIKSLETLLEGFPGGSAGKEPACNAGDLGSIPGLGRPLGEANGYSLQYSRPENSMEREPGGLQSTGW